VSSCLILYCAVERNEPNELRGRRGHGRGLEARTGSAEWRETGGTRDGGAGRAGRCVAVPVGPQVSWGVPGSPGYS